MIELLPNILFYFLVSVVLILFLWIIKIIFFTQGINFSIGKKVLILFLIIILAASFSYFISWLLQKGEVMQPGVILKIEKPSLLTSFPSGPDFVQIGSYYFSGPFSINYLYTDSPASIWTVLCENDIIGIGGFFPAQPSFTQEEKECFLKECSDPVYAVLPFFSNEEIPELEKTINYLITKLDPQCNFYE